MANDKLAPTTGIKLVSLQQLADVTEALLEVAGDGLSLFDLPELGVPAGGGVAWEVPTPDGPEPRKELLCVLLDVQRVRQFYKDSETITGTPPDCASPDGLTGYGDPGGVCASCVLAQWGSGKNNSQQCSERRHVLLLMEGSALPYFLNVPPSSLKSLKQYLYGLAGEARRYWQETTRISLEKTKNATGIEYSRCVFQGAGPLAADASAVAATYRDNLKGMLATRIAEAPRAPDPAAVNVDDYTTA